MRSGKSENYNEIAGLLMKRIPQKIPFKIEDDYDVDQDNLSKDGELTKINNDIPEKINSGAKSIRSQLKFDNSQPLS